MKLGKHPSNQEIARLFRWVAAAYQVKSGDFFRIQAYQNAAESIDHTGANIRDLWEEKKLDKVSGLGPSLEEHLDELFRTGEVKHFTQVMSGLPQGMFPLLELSDVGPKTAFKLATELHLKSAETALADLRSAIDSGKLQGLPGIGEKTISQLGEALGARAKSFKKDRLFLPDAESLAAELMAYLQESPAVLETQALGSLRRRSATVGDIDVAVKTTQPAKVFAHLRHFYALKRLVSSGENTAMLIHSSGRQIDIKTHDPKGWGSMLQHYTGSKGHNIHLRTLAKDKGLSLSEYGIKTKTGDKTFTDEESFYRFLGMAYIPPELREDTGEIEAAKQGKLPKLVELKDIRGDLHVHTNLDWPGSHDAGDLSLPELFDLAQGKGYQYLGLSDHQPKSSLSAADRRRFVERRNQQIDRGWDKWRQKHPGAKLQVFKGLEVDIRPDGSLALEDESLEQLDYAIVSVHSAFSQSAAEATKRVLQALSHPKATIWGHPTGRKLNERRGLEYDWSEIFAFCAQKKTLIEINASPWRLDLPDSLVHSAVEAGLKLVIDTDTHHSGNFEFMRYGIDVARRGWAEAKDIANTLPYEKFKALLT